MVLLVGFLATAVRAQSFADESARGDLAGIEADSDAELELGRLWQEVLKYDDHDDADAHLARKAYTAALRRKNSLLMNPLDRIIMDHDPVAVLT